VILTVHLPFGCDCVGVALSDSGRESVSVCYLAKVSGEHAFDDRADLSDHPAREHRINQQTVKNSRLPVSQIKPPVGFDPK
jgi:hypothetical protein